MAGEVAPVGGWSNLWDPGRPPDITNWARDRGLKCALLCPHLIELTNRKFFTNLPSTTHRFCEFGGLPIWPHDNGEWVPITDEDHDELIVKPLRQSAGITRMVGFWVEQGTSGSIVEWKWDTSLQGATCEIGGGQRLAHRFGSADATTVYDDGTSQATIGDADTDEEWGFWVTWQSIDINGTHGGALEARQGAWAENRGWRVDTTPTAINALATQWMIDAPSNVRLQMAKGTNTGFGTTFDLTFDQAMDFNEAGALIPNMLETIFVRDRRRVYSVPVPPVLDFPIRVHG